MRKSSIAVMALLFALSAAGDLSAVERTIRSTGELPRFQLFRDEPYDDTLSYHDDFIPNFWTIPQHRGLGDDYYNVRFTPVPDSLERVQLLGVLLPVLDIPRHLGGPIGQPGMRVLIYESGRPDGEWAYPVELLDSIDVPFENLQFGGMAEHPYNFIDFGDLRQPISFNAPLDFHIGVTVIQNDSTRQIDTLVIHSDTARVSRDRSGIWDGRDSTWRTLLEIFPDDEGYNFAMRAVVEIDLETWILSPDGSLTQPTSLELGSAFPNPFNNRTTLSFGVPMGVPYRVALFDQLGKQTRELAVGAGMGRGFVTLDANSLAGGVYLVQLWTPQGVRSSRVMLIR